MTKIQIRLWPMWLLWRMKRFRKLMIMKFLIRTPSGNGKNWVIITWKIFGCRFSKMGSVPTKVRTLKRLKLIRRRRLARCGTRRFVSRIRRHIMWIFHRNCGIWSTSCFPNIRNKRCGRKHRGKISEQAAAKFISIICYKILKRNKKIVKRLKNLIEC